MDSLLPGKDINIDTLTTALADRLAKDSGAVEMKIRIYFGLGLESGANLKKLTLDAGNDSWLFLRGMVEMYLRGNVNVPLCINRLTEVLKNMDLKHCANEIEEWLKKKNPYHLKAPPSAEGTKELKPLLYNFEGSSPNFIGRIDEIKQLEELINGTNQPSATRTILLTSVSGMGGIGKTMLAREFANVFRNEYSGNANVGWIPCDTLNLAQTAFTDIAKQLNLAHQQNISVKELAKLVYDSLKSQPRKSLFVFDNLDDPDADWIDDILPRYENNIFGLITSRRRDVLPKCSTLNLNVFSLEDAIKLVGKYLPELKVELAADLAKELDCFPLALRIATAHIARSSLSSEDATKDYIKTFSLEKETNRKLRKFEMDGYTLTTYSTLKISLDKISQLENGNDIRDLLGLMSFLEPDKIKKEFVEQIFSRMKKTESGSANECLEILDMYSLITTESRNGHYYYKIHRLVQKLVQIELKQEEKKCILQVIVDTLCGSRDLFYVSHAVFIIGNLIGENGKLGFEKTFICDTLQRLLMAVTIFHKNADNDCCPKFVTIADNFIKRHLLNETDASLQLIPHYFREMRDYGFMQDPAIQTLYNGIYDQMQMPIEDPIISTVLFVYVLFQNKYLDKSVKLLEKICEMDLNGINARILPLEENGLISRICTECINKGSSDFKANDSYETNSHHISSIGPSFDCYLCENVSRMNPSLINNILDLGVSYNYGITVPLYLLHFKNNAIKAPEYLGKWISMSRLEREFFNISNFPGMDDKNLIETLHSLSYNFTYGDLYMIFDTAFYYYIDLQLYRNMKFALDALKTLPKDIPITKDLIITISPLFSGKINSITVDDLPAKFKIIKTNLEKEQLELDTKNELTKVAFASYLTKTVEITKNENHEFFTIPLKVAEILIKLGYGYEIDSRSFYFDPLVTCVLVASTTVEEQFKFYQYVARNWKSEGMVVGMLYLNTWFLLYEKFFEQENLEFDEDDLVFPVRIGIQLYLFLSPNIKPRLSKSFSSVLHSARIETNPLLIKWKEDLTKCFEILEIDNSLSFSDKLDKLLHTARYSSGDFVYTDGSKQLELKDYPVLLEVINKLRPS